MRSRRIGLARPVMPWNNPGQVILAAGLLAATAWGAVRADEALDQYAVAAGHYARQQWAFAAEEFEAYLREFPNHRMADQAVFFLGETLVQLGRYEEAREAVAIGAFPGG